jgi:nicotinate-nucleotide pyrophosphorylase (carboxylating)
MRERNSFLEISDQYLDEFIGRALAEDIGTGDITSDILIPSDLQGRAFLLVKARGILAGIDIVRQVFLHVDPSLQVELHFADGSRVKPGDRVADITGNVSGILKAERTALNILQRLSGIATQTAKYVAKTRGLAVKVADTRKTTPGLRILEKYAVRMGGGFNHRLDLGDGVLIKDNHLAAQLALGISLKDAVIATKKKAPGGLPVEVEVTSFDDALAAAEAGADIIMLDNMTPEEMSRAVSALPPAIKIEASGGVTLANIRSVALTGVDIISVGALTHSPKALDISLELEPQMLKLF